MNLIKINENMSNPEFLLDDWYSNDSPQGDNIKCIEEVDDEINTM